MIIRNIQLEDYNKDYLSLLEQLTEVNRENITYESFGNFVNNLSSSHQIIVIERDNIIIATGTVIIENKIIHGLNRVAHIEDIVVHSNYRSHGYGKFIINELINISNNLKCYKIILDCNEKNIEFYKKLGFIQKEIQMVKYD